MVPIKKLKTGGFDAVAVGLHPDLEIKEARELVKIPVLGLLQLPLVAVSS